MRLIDADEMRQDWLENGENEHVYDTNAVLNSLDEQPTIDAVPVARCRECKHWLLVGSEFTRYHVCRLKCGLSGRLNDSDFCSHGEKRKDGE